MKISTLLSEKKFLVTIIVAFLVLNIGCKKVDEALEYALNFDGVFVSTNGSEVVLVTDGNNKGSGKFTKVGTGMGVIVVGDSFAEDMERINENTWKGRVRDRFDGLFNLMYYGEISINDNGNLLTISPNGGAAYNYRKVSSGSGGTGSGTGTNTEILVNQCVSGSDGEKKIIRFTVPANVTKMEIRTFEEVGTCDRNAADLFIRKGSDPTVTKTPTYSWIADCAGIKPNREDEVCVFNNPGAGQWSVMLFGYNTFFISKLKITITK